MFEPRERGRAQSLYGLGPLLGPVLGNGEFASVSCVYCTVLYFGRPF